MENISSSKALALEALSGKATERVPTALFTWGFDYYWKAAEIEPWRLALGGSETWHQAHIRLYERHKPDIIFYTGGGYGPDDPELVEENSTSWFIKHGENGSKFELIKSSLSLRSCETNSKSCDPVADMRTKEDIDSCLVCPETWGETYLNGLSRLINELGDRALVLPHHSPGYICACYALGFERAMEAMLEEPELLKYASDRYSAHEERLMSELADAGAEAVFIADGWASCDIISPSQFDEFALPYQEAITRAAHKAGLKIILWNEGDILPILDREATLPIDAFAFEQPRKGADVTVEKVRKAFGPNRCLFGNVDSEELLKRNRPSEIAEAVELQIRMSGKGAPFVLSTGSPIPSDVEPEAVDAMLNACRNFRW